jgi:hypothetical protein
MEAPNRNELLFPGCRLELRLIVMSSEKRPILWLHGLALALPLALLSPALRALETPLADGTYHAVRGYNRVQDGCPSGIEIEGVRIAAGTIWFESGGVIWRGAIDRETGVIRIESAGIEPKPSGTLHIRGHHTRARLRSEFCGSGYFRIVR